MATVFVPLDREPVMRPVAAPTLPTEVAIELAAERFRLDHSPPLYNGPVLLCTGMHDGTVDYYLADYASALLHCRLADKDGISPLGACYLGACLIPVAPDGRTLWTLRGPQVMAPNTWQLGTAGAIDPGETPREACLREAAEELGIEEVTIRPLGYCTGPQSSGDIFYTAPLDPATPLRLSD